MRFLAVLTPLFLLPDAAANGLALAQTESFGGEYVSDAQRHDDKVGPGVLETLEREGSVHVIVALETPASLKRPERAKFPQIRRDVETAQNAVIGQLAPGEHSMRRRYRMIPAFATEIRSREALERLGRHPLVVKVDLDANVTAHLAESVPLIRADSMHARGYTGEGVVVAVLDTGIDTDHPDLSDDLVHEECFLRGDDCPNGLDRQSGPGAAEDDMGHGTHVSGIITSAGNVSPVGVAPDAQIVAVKVLRFDGLGWDSDIAAGLDWILDNRTDVQVVNMSIGRGLFAEECDRADSGTRALSTVINTLRSVGVTTFASTGNNDSPTHIASPACISGVISVGATNNYDRVLSFSNASTFTDLLAPGQNILSTGVGGGEQTRSGTSMASPHAAACAALQIDAERVSTSGSLEAWLKASGKLVADGRNDLNFPRIDCFSEPYSTSPSDLMAATGPPDATGGCGGTGSYTLNVVGGTISRTGDTAYNNWAVGYNCWGFDEQYVRVFIVADDPATFHHWESPSGHLHLLDGHGGTSSTTIETSFNLLGQSPTFQAVHTGGDPTPDLVVVNRGSAASSTIGPLSGGLSGSYPALAVDPLTDVMYAGGGGGNAALYTVEPNSGGLTLVGPTGAGISRIAAMDFHPNGTLYASVKVGTTGGPGANWLATLDPYSGAATLIGTFGTCDVRCSIEGMGAIAFDVGGVLYGALHERAQNGTPGLYMINRFTGSATFVAPIVDGSSQPASGGITSLQFVDGVLYGGTAISKTPPGDGGWLVKINESTGEFTRIGSSSVTGGRGLASLAVSPLVARPPNDNLADASPITSTPYHGSGSTAHATTEPSEAYGSCASDHGKSIWWSFTPSTDGRFEVNTNGSWINTALSIWTGSDHPLSEAACDDGSGEGTAGLIRFDGTAGETYFIRVVGYAGAEGLLGLNVDMVDFACHIQTDVPAEECLALSNLYEATNGPFWASSEGWKMTNSVCTWYGVTCGDGHVTGLSLSKNGLNGALPASIGDLTGLVSLGLSSNTLEGPIPESIGNLTNLASLELRSSHLNGSIPTSIGDLTGLTYLRLENNNLSGVLPTSIGNLTSLTRLQLNDNGLSGPIPESIGNLVNLTHLDLSGNQISGTIPTSIGYLTNLISLSLYWNAIEGPLPESIGNLVNLETLLLFGNDLSGNLPESIGNLTNLQQLELSYNALSGSIPESVGNLSALKGLFLDANELTGPIPESIGNLTGLGALWLFSNHLTGSIPGSIGNLTGLTELRLNANDLTGPIPESIGKMVGLRYLFLYDNKLAGPIPPTFGNLTGLIEIGLSTNNLEGTVPLPAAWAMTDWYLRTEPPQEQAVPTLPPLFYCSASGNPGLCLPDIPEYQALAPGGWICGIQLDPTCPPIVHAEPKVFLEGPYSNGAMQAAPVFTESCPSSQPYSDPVFDGTPLDCDQPVVVLSPPDSVMDWVLVSLREDVTAESEVPGSERAAFLKTNGSIVDTSGTILAFPGVAPGAYRLVVRHRNHASVMSADTLDLSDGLGSWDFTTTMSQAYSNGGAPMKQLPDGRFGMFACDANVDGQITAPDFNLWNAATTAGATGYEQADCNLDGQVTAPDFNLWNANTTAGARSQVPD